MTVFKIMIGNMARRFPGLLFALCVVGLQGQTGLDRGSGDRSDTGLPVLKDWFLSTGDWQNDPQLYVREFGTGTETVIMLHGGWGAEHSGLVEAVVSLKTEYRFVFYDQRGSLRSPFPDSLITFDRHIQDLEFLRKELDQDQLTLVGHSMGAVLASAYAKKYPKRIKRLVLMAPAHLKNPIPEEDSEIRQQQSKRFEAFMDRPGVQRELDALQLNRESPSLSSREQTAKFRINFAKRMLYDVGNWSGLAGGRALYQGHVFGLTANSYPTAGWNYLEAFAKEEYPVSIIAGDHDFLDMGNLLIKKWTAAHPEIALHIIKNAGHMLWIDQAEATTKALRQGLGR